MSVPRPGIVSAGRYRQRMKRKILISLLGYLLGVINNFWIIGLLGFQKLPFYPIWNVIIERTFSILCSITLVWFFCPKALRFFNLKIISGRRSVTIFVSLFICLPPIFQLNTHGTSVVTFAQSYIFALFIGLDEEIFDRGFVFGLFNYSSNFITASISSFLFGIEHFGNFLWGHQSFSFTLGQVLGAASFGFVMAGLMVYSGSIFPSIFLHGFVDFPMQFESKLTYLTSVSGKADWFGIFVDCGINVVLGATLLYLSSSINSTNCKVFER